MNRRGPRKFLVARALAVGASLACALWTTDAVAAPSQGQTIDYRDSSRNDPWRDRAWQARAYLHPRVLSSASLPRPVVVFLHGLNTDHIPFRWMGGAPEPDVRELIASLVDRDRIEAPVLAAPSTITDCDLPHKMWPTFDLDRFLAVTVRALGSRILLDPTRVILVGHSGAGCNTSGGMIAALRAQSELKAALVIDTCMDVVAAPLFALARPETDVVIAWQPLGWGRPFEAFERAFRDEGVRQHARGLRTVVRVDVREPHAHNGIVAAALEAWLPLWLPPAAKGDSPGDVISAP